MVRLQVILIVSYVFFTPSIFIILLTLSLSADKKESGRSFLSFFYQATMAHPPPCPKSGKQDECWGDRGKKDIGE